MTAPLQRLRTRLALALVLSIGAQVVVQAQGMAVYGGPGRPSAIYGPGGAVNGVPSVGAEGGTVSITAGPLSAFSSLYMTSDLAELTIGSTGLSIDRATGQNTLLGATHSNGIANTGHIGTTTFASTGNGQVGGNFGVTGLTSTHGIANNGGIATTTLNVVNNATVGGALTVVGPTTTHGIANTGAISTGTLATTGNAAVGGNLTVQGVASTNGIDNNGQVIRNVAPGVAPTDAVNLQQMNAMSGNQAAALARQDGINATQANVNSQQGFTNTRVQQQLSDNRKVASTGVAVAVAAASIPALEAGKTVGVGAGVGHYDGHAAFAVGLAARVNESLQIKLNVGTGPGGRAAVGAGGMWSW